MFPSNDNISNLWFAAWLPEIKNVSSVTLFARTYQGVTLGFPKVYNIYLTSPDNSHWMFVKRMVTTESYIQSVMIDFDQSYWTYGILIDVESLGVDDYNNHYFQLAEIQF